MKTAEEYFKERCSAVYSEDKHERKIQRFDYYDMTDFAAQYASEAIREKDDAINRLKDRLEKAWQMGDIKPKELDLIMQLAAKDKEIEQLKAKQTKCELSNSDIFSWLQSKKFQTEKGEQEYSMYFDVDMPKIIRAAIDELSGKTEQFTGPVVGVEDDTPFTNRR